MCPFLAVCNPSLEMLIEQRADSPRVHPVSRAMIPSNFLNRICGICRLWPFDLLGSADLNFDERETQLPEGPGCNS